MAQTQEQQDAGTLAEQVAALATSVDGTSKAGKAFLAGAETALRAVAGGK